MLALIASRSLRRVRLTALATIAALGVATAVPEPGTATEYARLHAPPVAVDVALVLAVDVSQSVDEDELKIQRRGYVDALTSKEVLEAIRTGLHGRIAVTYMEWGSDDQQSVLAPWYVVDGEQSAKEFVAQIAEAPIRNLYRTSISMALRTAAELLETSGTEPVRKVIDISGDGPNNQGPSVEPVRDELVARGIVINGLPLIMHDADAAWSAQPKVDEYYQDCVIGGAGSFMIPVAGLENFNNALKMKLILEIAGVSDAPSILPASGRRPVNCRAME